MISSNSDAIVIIQADSIPAEHKISNQEEIRQSDNPSNIDAEPSLKFLLCNMKSVMLLGSNFCRRTGVSDLENAKTEELLKKPQFVRLNHGQDALALTNDYK